jgi:hypothetical protein
MLDTGKFIPTYSDAEAHIMANKPTSTAQATSQLYIILEESTFVP